MLSQCYKMHLKDENILEIFAQRIRDGKYRQVNHLTNILYWFGKFKFRSAGDNVYIQKAMDIILSEPALTPYIATRNMWNLYALDYYDKVTMERFSEVIIQSEADKMHDLDISNAVRSFAHF